MGNFVFKTVLKLARSQKDHLKTFYVNIGFPIGTDKGGGALLMECN